MVRGEKIYFIRFHKEIFLPKESKSKFNLKFYISRIKNELSV